MLCKSGLCCGVGLIAGAAIVAVFSGVDLRAGSDVAQLPRAAEDAVKAEFPTATIVAVETERDAGVRLYEVILKDGGERFEVEITAAGEIAEIERAATLADLPRAALDAIVRVTGGALVHEVERSEIRGRADGQTFVPVDPPLIVFEVEYQSAVGRRELTVTADGRTVDDDDDDDDDDGHDADDEDEPGRHGHDHD